jgi:hypothetical protein
LLVIARPVLLAREGAPIAVHDVRRAWSLEPAVLESLALAGGLYALGLRRRHRRSPPGHVQPDRPAAMG